MRGSWLPTSVSVRHPRGMRIVTGLGLAVGLSLAALVAGARLPVVGAPVFALVLGVLAGHLLRHPSWLGPGAGFAGRVVLQASIVVLGAGLSLGQVVRVGAGSLPVMLGSLAVALGAAVLIGRRLQVGSDARLLIGVGTGVCGASAIAAVSSIARPKDAEVGYALGTIFAFNLAAVLVFPPLGRLLGMSGHEFGLWSGTAVNDTSSVVAVAYAFGHGAGPYAIVVKLTRALMIIPITVALAWRRARAGGEAAWSWRVLPGFIFLFLLAAGLNTAGLVPASWHHPVSVVGTVLVSVALAGIGLGLRWADVRQAGPRPLALGALVWVFVALSSLGLQTITAGS